METSMTQIKPVFMEKHEREYRDETFSVALSAISGFL